MKISVKEMFANRKAIIALAMAIIMSVSVFSFSGLQKNAWAEAGDTLATWTSEEAFGVGTPIPSDDKQYELKLINGGGFTVTKLDGTAIPASTITFTGEEGTDPFSYDFDASEKNEAEGSGAKGNFTSAVLVERAESTDDTTGGGDAGADEEGNGNAEGTENEGNGEGTEGEGNGDANGEGEGTEGEGGENEEAVTYTVTFDNMGHGAELDQRNADENGLVDMTDTELTEEGWTFTGWFTHTDFKEKFDPSIAITEDITLYASWAEDTSNSDDGKEEESDDKKDESDNKKDESDGKNESSDSNAATTPEPEPTNFTIVVTKTDAKTGAALSGAEFTLADKAGNAVARWTTDGTAKTFTLNRDTTYVLTETKAPAGYNREKAININFSNADGKASVLIDQGGKAVALTTNADGNATLNVKDLSGATIQGVTTTAQTGDNTSLPLVSLCFAGAALAAGAVAAGAYRKHQNN